MPNKLLWTTEATKEKVLLLREGWSCAEEFRVFVRTLLVATRSSCSKHLLICLLGIVVAIR